MTAPTETLTSHQNAAAPSVPGASDPGAEGRNPSAAPTLPQPAAPKAPAAAPSRRQLLPRATLGILAALLLGFAGDLTVLGRVRHARDQRIAYSEFRIDLANAVAPVGQLDRNGKLLKLGTPVALLDIPAIGLREVVRAGTTAGVMRSGPGHRRDTPLPGQLGTSIVMGRKAAYGAPFRKISTLVSGDVITATTGQGKHTYQVIGIRRAGDEVPVLQARGRLTLVTADGAAFAPSGVIYVDADLTSKARVTPDRVFRRASLPKSELVMANDPSAWILVVLWAQALLAAALALAWTLRRWGKWQTWIAGVPVLLALGLALADQAAHLLPNVL